ncbi:SAV_6107 family HEPN domain-containing protein [Corynebacterium propinquum]|uniref:SAV_6107 family HEPN domain-containing protein n=1 Tax=Corynebacterium propinquum TaxID=43769 RepID=UPI00266FB686|nr:SAV_6107 family HEPN domain-containing protein [Corynebacterium propinquum]WKS32618.1 SAV_6107 family HEPN domain-containing protein [Corynebacterium propinquum]WKS36674.1 SAV_6107 family HEPN domain-containing protein [Corynebacterium propinquum]WKS38007.1 SAV_6107 family HEPN domain-containing protein [Corynebacterium propinquum]WKS43254.1 SAV_6107 family HEPN domain-containing protein [Corynebacterium propinquum]WKS46568.1 SAV_6107 family HEPN domain-containing protein [Corynebacterium p
MPQVISATTKFNHTASLRRGGMQPRTRRSGATISRAGAGSARVDSAALTRHRKLVASAEMLMGKARAYLRDGDASQALEFACWAGLRLAGARVAVSPVGKRRRKPTSAWEQLALVDAAGKQWVHRFQPYSRVCRDIGLGLGAEISELQVMSLLKLVDEFLVEVAAQTLVERTAA